MIIIYIYGSMDFNIQDKEKFMKRLILILFLTGFVFADMKYYAICKISDKSILSTFSQDLLVKPLVSIDITKVFLFEITQSEYASEVNQATIDTAYTAAIAYQKDINNISKLEKCGFLVIMDYLRALGCTKTNGQFKNDVITKYEGS